MVHLTLAAALRRLLVSGFVVVHMASILWWNLPEDGFPSYDRTARLPAPLVAAEQRLFEWKRRAHRTSPLADALEAYTQKTATWQNWYLFAPNPFSGYRYLTVYAVVGQDARGKPIYDPTPLYTSYRGTLDEELARSAGARNLWSPYEPHFKLATNLASGEFDPELGIFARYWTEVYARREGRRARGVDIVQRAYDVPPAFSGIAPRDMKPRDEVLWWLRD